MKMLPTDISVAKAILFNNGILNPTDSQIAIQFMRTTRNLMLKSSDWMANSDVTMTEEWRLYRQALRDITTQTPSLDVDGNLTGIMWPTPPND